MSFGGSNGFVPVWIEVRVNMLAAVPARSPRWAQNNNDLAAACGEQRDVTDPFFAIGQQLGGIGQAQ